MPITLEDARERTTLGSGVVMAFTDEIDLVDVLVRISQFFRDESCGQCVLPGRLRPGTDMTVNLQRGGHRASANCRRHRPGRSTPDPRFGQAPPPVDSAISRASPGAAGRHRRSDFEGPARRSTAGRRVPEGTSIQPASRPRSTNCAGETPPPTSAGKVVEVEVGKHRPACSTPRRARPPRPT